MKLFVLFGHRKEDYPDQHGLEALACATQADTDENPDYLPEQLEKYQASREFGGLGIVQLEVSGADIRRRIYPELSSVPADVIA